MKTTKKYTLIALLVEVMIFVTLIVLMSFIPGIGNGNSFIVIAVIFYAISSVAATIICTGIIVSKIESLNNKAELNEEDN